MNIGIIDADLIGGANNRFPNLACMKLSSYHKARFDAVSLLLNYDTIGMYDLVYVSKVFSKSEFPEAVKNMKNVEIGGTGFFYDKSPGLPKEAEHIKPDYDLYSSTECSGLEYYKDYSIGFTTRHCFRGCEYCVNKNYKHVDRHSPVEEFLDGSKKYICLLDDNVFGYIGWKDILEELEKTGKPFQFKQGMDIRLLTKDKAEVLNRVLYKGDFIFAFDDIKDRDLIERKLELWRSYGNRSTKLYVLCAYDRTGKYSRDFWMKDLTELFDRLAILMKYECLPYLMRYDEYVKSPYAGLYIELARWCNQPSCFKKKTFEDFCLFLDPSRNLTVSRYKKFTEENKEFADKYFNLKFGLK